MMRSLILVVTVLLLSGCFRATIRGGPTHNARPEDATGASFLWGLTESKSSAGECATGLARVSVFWPWWGPLVYGLTLGLVAPIRTEYVCAPPSAVAPLASP
jgi:hypothetical protein